MTAQRSRTVQLLQRIRHRPFIASMAVLFGGSALSALLGFAATPLLTRIYSPAEFGVLGVFTAALSLFSVVATLRYDRAIPGAADDRDAASVLVVALTTVLCTSVICCILVMVGALGYIISAARGQEGLLAWALPLGMAAMGAYDALSFWMVRRRDYPTLSVTKVSQGATTVGSQLVLGFTGWGAVGLVAGQIAGSSTGIIRLSRRVLRFDRAAFTGIGIESLRATAKTYRRFPMLSVPAVLMDALTGALPVLVIAHRFGPAAAGVLTVVTRVVLAPLALVTTNIGQIIFGELAELQRTGSKALLDLFYRRLKQIALLGILLVAAMLVLVPLLLPRILGPRWGEATTYFLIMAPMVFLGFISSPFGVAIDVLRRQDLHFLRDFLRAGVLVIAVVLAKSYDMNTLETLKALSLAGCINGVIYLTVCWYAFAAEPKRSLLF